MNKRLQKLYELSRGDLSKISTRDLNYFLSLVSHGSNGKPIRFGRYSVNDSKEVENLYKTRITQNLTNELLKRNMINMAARDRIHKRVTLRILSLLSALILFFSIGYSNRSEKEKVSVNNGIARYSNGMTYSGFSTSDLEKIFNFNGKEEANLFEDVFNDAIAGFGNLLSLSPKQDITLDKAMNEAETILKYLGVLVLDGVRDNDFHFKGLSSEVWNNIDLKVTSDIQSLCRVYTLGSVIEKYSTPAAIKFYKNVYHMENGEKVFFESKDDLMRFAGFSNEEEFNDFMLNVIYTLNGNVFFYSEPTAGEVISLKKTI